MRRFTWERSTCLVLALLGGMTVLGAVIGVFRSGIGWDAGIDTLAAQQVSDIPSGSTLQSAYEMVYSTSEFYGVFVQRSASWLAGLFGIEPDQLTSGNLATYRWQAVVCVIVAVTAALCFGWVMARVTRSVLLGIFSFAALLSWPLFFGMSFVDFKDMPVAAGLTIFSSGLVACWTSRSCKWVIVAGVSMSSIGAFIALGTRIGTWPLLVALSCFTAIVYFIDSVRGRKWHTFLIVSAATLISGGVAGVLLWLSNPIARISLPHWLVDSYLVSKAFPVNGLVRFAGEDVDMTNLPWTYAPRYFLAQAPILGAIWFLCSVVVVIAMLLTVNRATASRQLVDSSPYLIQGFALAAVIVFAHSVLYDGVRHLLFVIPAIVCVLALGLSGMEKMMKERLPRLKGVALFLVATSIVGTAVIADARWFPYSYAFVNPVAGSDADHRAWELDFWGLSSLEAVARFHELGISDVRVLPEPPSQGMVEVSHLSSNRDTENSSARYGVYVIQRGDSKLPSDKCVELFRIVRDGHTLGVGSSCP